MSARAAAAACAIALLMLEPTLLAGAQRSAASAETGTLTVIVVTDEAVPRPLSRASVSLQADQIGVPLTAVTDQQGRARFERVAPRNYVLSAVKPAYVRTFHGSRTPGTGPGVPVAIVAGQAIEVRLAVPRGAVITGTVHTPGGRPAANVTIQAVNPKRSTQWGSLFYDPTTGIGRTDDRGVYRIFGLPAGEYVIAARQDIVSQELRAVTLAELQWADRVVSGTAGAGGAPSTTAAPETGPTAAFAPVFYPGTTMLEDASVVRVAPGDERAGMDVTLQLVRTAQIRGRLVDADGRPQPNQSIAARAPRPAGGDLIRLLEASIASTTRSGVDGSFTLTGMRPGHYTLEVRATPAPDGAAGAPPRTGTGAGTHWARQEVSMAGVDITDLVLTLRPGMVVSGCVVYEGTSLAPPDGALPGALRLIPGDASLFPAIGSPATETRMDITAEKTFSGRGIAPGRYRLVTQAALIGALVPDATALAGGWALKSAMAGGRDVSDATLEVRPGEDVTDVVVTFTDRPTSLSGQVFDQAGRPTSSFPIVIFSTDRAAWVPSSRRVRLVRPATDGTFTALGLPSGEYHIAAVTAVEPDQLADPAFLEQMAAMSITLSLADGERKTQNLKLGG